MFIRASRETHSGELVLVVRPNVYIGEDPTDPEPDFMYNPDTQGLSTPLPPGSDPLSGSIMLLCEALESGAALAQFEVSTVSPGLKPTSLSLCLSVSLSLSRILFCHCPPIPSFLALPLTFSPSLCGTVTFQLSPGKQRFHVQMCQTPTVTCVLTFVHLQQMYRKKPGLTHNAARQSDNICKNRYRDISPCEYLSHPNTRCHV